VEIVFVWCRQYDVVYQRTGGSYLLYVKVATMILETIVLVLGISSVASYETTGKGLADHAISKVADKDCKIARIVHDEKICQKEPQGVVTVSAPNTPVVSDAVARANDVFANRARR
jgi:hypothetical protein